MEMSSKPTSVLFEAENYDDEDDTFYAEIRRQILLLTSEDNEDLIETKSFNTVSVTNGGGSNIRSSYGFSKGVSPPASSFCSWGTESSALPPDWLVNLWKHGKGTGVFIPQVARKKNHRSGRVDNGRRRIYRPVVNKD